MRTCIYLLIVAALVGCKPAAVEYPPMDYAGELPPGMLALRKISPERYPDFSAAFTNPNLPDVLKAIDYSLKYLSAPSSQHYYPYADISHDRAVATLHALHDLLQRDLVAAPAHQSAADFNRQVADTFEVYQSVGAPRQDGSGNGTGQVLFTGYFTPIYPASLTKTAEFKWPLYKRPADLVSDEEGEHAWRRPAATTQPGTDHNFPYWTRQEIEQQHKLDGQELVYLSSRWDAYVIAVQGSARLRLTDGKILEVGYAGNNGFDYVSPGKQMIADGIIPKSQLSLKGLRGYFEQRPEMMDKYLSINPRFVFFTERTGGPFGKLNVPVTAMASIATDKKIYPRAMPAFVTTQIPTGMGNSTAPFKAWMLDQDAGGAIRAAGRCDLYMGIGPAAEAIAGQQMYPGELYYLAIKPELMKATTTPVMNK